MHTGLYRTVELKTSGESLYTKPYKRRVKNSPKNWLLITLLCQFKSEGILSIKCICLLAIPKLQMQMGICRDDGMMGWQLTRCGRVELINWNGIRFSLSDSWESMERMHASCWLELEIYGSTLCCLFWSCAVWGGRENFRFSLSSHQAVTYYPCLRLRTTIIRFPIQFINHKKSPSFRIGFPCLSYNPSSPSTPRLIFHSTYAEIYKLHNSWTKELLLDKVHKVSLIKFFPSAPSPRHAPIPQQRKEMENKFRFPVLPSVSVVDVFSTRRLRLL